MAGDVQEDEDRAARDEEGSQDPPARGRGRGKGRGRKGNGKGRGKKGGRGRGRQVAEPTEEPDAKKQKIDSKAKPSSNEPEKALDQPDQPMPELEVPQDSQQPLHGCEVPTPEVGTTEIDEDRSPSKHDATTRKVAKKIHG